MCEIARTLFPHIGRIIARPFIGEKGNFKRTPERKDYSLPPPDLTLFDLLTKKGIPVITIGKVDHLFAGRGINESIHTKDNDDVMTKTIKIMDKAKGGLIFSNFVDFDMLWGHRNDVKGFVEGLCKVDAWIPKLLNKLDKDDVLFITADHGTDPTTTSTDHSREYIPILVYGERVIPGKNLGTRESFSDVGATIGEYFGIKIKNGKSFLKEIYKPL
jgi:phosphopentomutase